MNLPFDLNVYNIGNKELSKDKYIFYIIRTNCNTIKIEAIDKKVAIISSTISDINGARKEIYHTIFKPCTNLLYRTPGGFVYN